MLTCDALEIMQITLKGFYVHTSLKKMDIVRREKLSEKVTDFLLIYLFLEFKKNNNLFYQYSQTFGAVSKLDNEFIYNSPKILIFVLHTNLRIFSIDQTECKERKKERPFLMI
jgi:hypothetical protein